MNVNCTDNLSWTVHNNAQRHRCDAGENVSSQCMTSIYSEDDLPILIAMPLRSCCKVDDYGPEFPLCRIIFHPAFGTNSHFPKASAESTFTQTSRCSFCVCWPLEQSLKRASCQLTALVVEAKAAQYKSTKALSKSLCEFVSIMWS